MKTEEIISLYEKIGEIPPFWLPDTQKMRYLQFRNVCFLFFQEIFKICKENVGAPDPNGSSSIEYFPVYSSNSAFMCMHYHYDTIIIFCIGSVS